MPVDGYFIQYKFILPESTSHSSYSYQKLFRALYGYTQAVNKSSGKNYKYHRKGVLSDYPYLRAGKNCVIIAPDAFQGLIAFFKTGKNPTHNWETKGNWKAVYYMDEKAIPEQKIVKAVENLIDRSSVEKGANILAELRRIGSGTLNAEYEQAVISLARGITKHPWFLKACEDSPKLKEFKKLADARK
ncbi:MAG: hypothetical protein NT067_04680 [Candidatus Diapherotrites archaeon]|nr:hypothetical protein [Candidatus Diapherotrites archaeon]